MEREREREKKKDDDTLTKSKSNRIDDTKRQTTRQQCLIHGKAHNRKPGNYGGVFLLHLLSKCNNNSAALHLKSCVFT